MKLMNGSALDQDPPSSSEYLSSATLFIFCGSCKGLQALRRFATLDAKLTSHFAMLNSHAEP